MLKAWTFEALFKRIGVADPVLVTLTGPTVVGNDAGAATWIAEVIVSGSNDAIAVSGVGQAAKTIDWDCRLTAYPGPV